MIADLVRIELPALSGQLDLERIELMPTEFVAMDRSRSIGDALCRIPFANRGEPARRYALASAEFQDRNDSDMLARMREYTERMLEDGRHRGLILRSDAPLLIPFVIYTGRRAWRAADGSEPMAGLPPEAVHEVALCQRQGYIAVDIGGRKPLPAGAPENRFLAAARLVKARAPDVLRRQLLAELRRFAGPEHERFRVGMHAWVQEGLLTTDLALPPLDELENAKESEMTQLYEDRGLRWRNEWLEQGRDEGRTEGLEAGREEGREEGVVTGQRDLLVTMAEQRFGAAAGRRLAKALNDHPTAGQLSTTSALILACDTEEDFVKRLSD